MVAYGPLSIQTVGCGVVSPPITFPKGNETFHESQTISVRWNASVVPANCTPYSGILSLGYNYGARNPLNNSRTHRAPPSEGGSVLVPSVDLRAGAQNITFPDNLTTRDDYVLVLFGDALNVTPFFRVIGTGNESIIAPPPMASASFPLPSTQETLAPSGHDSSAAKAISSQKQCRFTVCHTLIMAAFLTWILY
ncbi:hypothetical protein BXZ70DRAFT_577980 [Cristinia sonorae]|uniref:Uncharacterized protein n=1 Tax=Cristinia sonorae TaxID=1940300 RepID=A0A8K0UG34_9AGAR|nr:hypothetical protein BXZ70DRAFT_577980 [Cristinia sonorae]